MSGTTDPQLQHTLKKRHLSMIAIAGVIGAGLFVGSGVAIRETGPGVLVAYALAGIVVILVMRMLGEMSTANPETGSFSAYADRAIGRWAGFSIGWLYAWFWIIVLGIEATAGAVIMNRWIPDVPQWSWALILMVLLTLTNIASVKSFGEFEFWFASIKVAAIVIFLVLGVLAICGALPGVEAPGLTNLTGHGGFFPNGQVPCSRRSSSSCSPSSAPRSPPSPPVNPPTPWQQCATRCVLSCGASSSSTSAPLPSS